jgi:PAS domain S-box-containing protein
MKARVFFRTIRPYISASIVIATATVLVLAIYYTDLSLQWVTFLAGILVSAMIAEATRVSHMEWVAMRRLAQLAALKCKLELEAQLRKSAEKSIAVSKPRLHLIDEVLTTMVVLIDVGGLCQYCNHAFKELLHLRSDQIIGQHIRKVLGSKIYQETATSIRQSLDGNPVQYERTQMMPDGAVYKLLVEHIPQYSQDGKVSGFFMLMNDITSPSDVSKSQQKESLAATHAGIDNDADLNDLAHDGMTIQDRYIDTFAEQITGHQDVNRIKESIQKGDFRLFSQLISHLTIDSVEAKHYEILVRLIEEEEGMMPPGAFFPMAEKYGLMPHLDRWVVQHVTAWASHQNLQNENKNNAIFFINVSGATIADPSFPEFLQLTLLEYGVSGSVLCFEIPNIELALRTSVVAEFARHVRKCGCLVAISSFGHGQILFDLIRDFRVEYLKIDGSIIFNILRDPVALAKLTAINRVAKLIGVKTIAELVESEETIGKLREVGIDFAQGFGISRPEPLAR